MGIRINKKLGWGITIEIDPQKDINNFHKLYDHLLKIKIIDIFNEDKNNLLNDEKSFMKSKKISFDQNLTLFYKTINIKEKDIFQVVILITPPAMIDSWSRSDDLIDYYDSENMNTNIQYLYNKNIFPYIERMISLENPTQIIDKIDYIKKTQSGKDIFYMHCPLIVEKIFIEIQKNMISLLKEHSSFDLKPMLITYWE